MLHLTEVHEDPLGIADQLDEHGVVCLKDAAAPDWLAEARRAVEQLLHTHGERDHFIRSPHGEQHRAAETFIANPAVLRLLEDVVRTRFPEATAELTGTALRVIAGPRGDGDAYWFHYDASVITMVVPLILPDAGRGNSGELVGFFNKRPFRRFALINVIDKVVGQSGWYRQLILRRLGRKDRPKTVDMELGNIYLFWGYRSLHGNMPCESGAVRATLLLHFGRPHQSSRVLRTALRIQDMIRNRRPKPAGSSAEELAPAA